MLHEQIYQLLAESRAQHLQKKHCAGRADKRGTVISPPNYPKAETHIAEALRLRQLAEALDADHTAPAWIEDLAQNKGATSAELIEFYKQYLVLP